MQEAACSDFGCGGFTRSEDRLHGCLRPPKTRQVLVLLVPSEQRAGPALRARGYGDRAHRAATFATRITEHRCSSVVTYLVAGRRTE
jgi:hypothetical protein